MIHPTPSAATTPSVATTEIDGLLDRLRGQVGGAIATRIGWQVAAAVAAVGWASVTLDRLFEPSPTVRLAVGSVVVLLGAAWIVLVAAPRLLRPITDRQLLSLLHREHAAEASLMATALDLRAGPPIDDDAGLHAATLEAAEAAATRLDEVRLVRPSSSMGVAGFAAVALSAAVLAATVRPDLATCFANRLALSEQPWPRRVALTAEGFRWESSAGEWVRVVARGEPTEFVVFAETDGADRPPETLWAREAKTRRLTTLARIGSTTNEGSTRQAYRRRVERADADLAIVVTGGDARLALRLIVADRPRLTGLMVRSTVPDYLASTRLASTPLASTPATLPPLPEGSTVTLSTETTKPLAEVSATMRSPDGVASPVPSRVVDEGAGVVVAIGTMRRSGVVSIDVTDHDGLASDPLDLPIEIVRDTPPTAILTLDGVGRSITRDARVPVRVAIADDHGVRDVTLALAGAGQEIELSLDAPPEAAGDSRGVADLLSLRTADAGTRFAVKPGDTVSLTASASDAYDLSERPPTASGTIQLQVVPPAELLAQIGDAQRDLRGAVEGRRDDLGRLAYELDLQRRRLEESPEAAAGAARWSAERRIDARQAAEGLAKAAERADGLRHQVENNRLDQPALIDRLRRQVTAPLRRVAEEELARVQASLAEATDAASIDPASLDKLAASVAKSVAIVERVAAALDTQQTYNEVVSLLRGLIREQRRVNQKTVRQEGESVRRLFD